MSTRHTPVSRFPSEMINLLVEGAKEKKEIPLETRKQCTVLRQKLYMLRAAMKREGHFAYKIAERAEVKIKAKSPKLNGPNDPHYLVVSPANREYVHALQSAGITANEELETSDMDFQLPETERPVQETDFVGILKRNRTDDNEEERLEDDE